MNGSEMLKCGEGLDRIHGVRGRGHYRICTKAPRREADEPGLGLPTKTCSRPAWPQRAPSFAPLHLCVFALKVEWHLMAQLLVLPRPSDFCFPSGRSEEHTSELQSL